MRQPLTAALIAVALLLAGAGSASADFTEVGTVVNVSALSSAAKSVGVVCPAGKKVVGMGANAVSESGEEAERVLLDAIRPGAQLNGVTARAREDEAGTSQSWRVLVYAMCAPAPAGLQLVTATSASSSAAKSIVAACPAGKRLLGSGGEATGPLGQVLLDGILPSSGLTVATVNALEDETGTTSEWTVTAYAICSNPVRGLQRVAATSASDSATHKPVTAACPAGKALISAGATINSSTGQVLLGSLRLIEDPPWAIASAHEDASGNAGSWSLTAYGVCAAGARRVSGTVQQSGSATVGEAGCPAGMESTGFGGQITGAIGRAWLRWLRPNGDASAAVALAATTYGDAGWPLTTHAICRSRASGTVVRSAAAPLDATKSKSVTVTCPDGTRVVGAGGQGADTTNSGVQQGVTLQGVRPDAALRSVTVTAERESFPGPFEFQPRAWAVCAPPPLGLERVAVSSPAGNDEVGYTTATCPAGKHLTGIGGEIVGGGDRIGFDDVVPDPGLTSAAVFAARGVASPPNWWVTAYGICVNR